jgi:type IV pilus assembly protein PilC
MVSMVRAGEESGKLAESFSTVGEQMEKTYLLKRKVRGALIYPTIVITALLAVGVLMLIYVVPVLSETFGELEVELPRSTQLVITVSDFLTENTFFALIILAGLIFLFTASMRTERGRRVFDFSLLHLPFIKTIVKDINTARTARTFSSLLSSGVEVVVALSITRDIIQNSYFREVIEQAQKEVERGGSMAGAFGEYSKLYPILLSEMMAVGEETGKLPEMLSRIADFYENEVEQKTKNISTVIEPLLMIFVGAVVGFFALSMITPIYSLSSAI